MRLSMALPVHLSGLDSDGHSFELEATTVYLTRRGARLRGITRSLQLGSTVTLKYRFSTATVQVMWVGKPGSRMQDVIGVHMVGIGQLNWGRTIPIIFGDGFPTPEAEEEDLTEIFQAISDMFSQHRPTGALDHKPEKRARR